MKTSKSCVNFPIFLYFKPRSPAFGIIGEEKVMCSFNVVKN